MKQDTHCLPNKTFFVPNLKIYLFIDLNVLFFSIFTCCDEHLKLVSKHLLSKINSSFFNKMI